MLPHKVVKSYQFRWVLNDNWPPELSRQPDCLIQAGRNPVSFESFVATSPMISLISDLGRWRRKKVRVVMLRTIFRSFSRFCSISTRRLLRNSAEENVKHLLSRKGEGLTCWSIGEFPEFLPLFSTQAPPTLTVSLSEHLKHGWFSAWPWTPLSWS